MLLLICVIAVICVIAPFGRPSETEELSKDIERNEEEISAATATTVNAGQTYTVPQNGIYKIELHGGHGEGIGKAIGGKGSKVTGYIKLNKDNILTTESYSGGGNGGLHHVGRGGDSIHISLNDTRLMGAGGGVGSSYISGVAKCMGCQLENHYWDGVRYDEFIEANKLSENEGFTHNRGSYPYKKGDEINNILVCIECGSKIAKCTERRSDLSRSVEGLVIQHKRIVRQGLVKLVHKFIVMLT